MSIHIEKEEHTKELEEVEISRKNVDLCRKSWSLTDRKPDQEVLREMGVSLLDDLDENEQFESSLASTMTKQVQKRKYDIENVNPNIYSAIIASPMKARQSPHSKQKSPCAGTSRVKSCEKAVKQNELLDEQLIETTLGESYLIEEETPLGQTCAGGHLAHRSSDTIRNTKKRKVEPLGVQEELSSESEPCGADAFSGLCDEVMLQVFHWLPKLTLAHCMTVCRRWHRVASDETLWQRLDLGNKTLCTNALGRILARKPIIVRLAGTEIGPWQPATEEQSRIQYLDLSMCCVGADTLAALLQRCAQLRRLSLEAARLRTDAAQAVGRCSNLETLNLTMSTGLTAEDVRVILTGCSSLQSLNISWCNMNEEALNVLVETLPPKLQRLNVSGARIMTDDMVGRLSARCPRLSELDLSDCPRLSAASLLALRRLPALQHLALSRCYMLPAHDMAKLSAVASLQYLEVWGMLQSGSLNALKAALPGIQINQFMFSAIARPTVGTRRTSIWGLRTRD